MAFQRPSLSDLVTRIKADLSSRILGSSTALRRSFIGILAIVWAGAVYLLYGFLSWIGLMVIPDTSEDEFVVRWASFKGLTQKAAVFEQGTVTFTTTSDPQTILAGTLMQANDGTQYKAVSNATSSALAVVVTVIALETPPTASTRNNGDAITLLSPQAAVLSQGSWTSTTTEGAAQETTDALKARMLTAFQTPPQGGAKADYVSWALQVASVTRAWCFPNYLGAGTVGVTFVCDGNGSGSAIIPSGGVVTQVYNYITDPTRAPVTANVTVFAPTPATQNFTIHLSADTTALRALVLASLQNLIFQYAVPGGTMYLSQIRAAIQNVIGDSTFTLTVPAADQVFTNGQIGIMGTITWA